MCRNEVNCRFSSIRYVTLYITDPSESDNYSPRKAALMTPTAMARLVSPLKTSYTLIRMSAPTATIRKTARTMNLATIHGSMNQWELCKVDTLRQRD